MTQHFYLYCEASNCSYDGWDPSQNCEDDPHNHTGVRHTGGNSGSFWVKKSPVFKEREKKFTKFCVNLYKTALDKQKHTKFGFSS